MAMQTERHSPAAFVARNLLFAFTLIARAEKLLARPC